MHLVQHVQEFTPAAMMFSISQNLDHCSVHSHSYYQIYPGVKSLLLMCSRKVIVEHRYMEGLAKSLPILPYHILRLSRFRNKLAKHDIRLFALLLPTFLELLPVLEDIPHGSSSWVPTTKQDKVQEAGDNYRLGIVGRKQ